MTTSIHTSWHAVHPEGWARASGYTNGAVVTGRQLYLAGQVGWNPATATFDTDDFAGQVRQAFHNIVTILAAAQAEPRHLVRLTWYITDKAAYTAARREIGAAYREIIGAHYPPMSVVVVSALIEDRAQVEIEATAVIPENPLQERTDA
jgi:enamine deaminase RidA (YjgF/YER057c/UK114 family)